MYSVIKELRFGKAPIFSDFVSYVDDTLKREYSLKVILTENLTYISVTSIFKRTHLSCYYYFTTY